MYGDFFCQHPQGPVLPTPTRPRVVDGGLWVDFAYYPPRKTASKAHPKSTKQRVCQIWRTGLVVNLVQWKISKASECHVASFSTIGNVCGAAKRRRAAAPVREPRGAAKRRRAAAPVRVPRSGQNQLGSVSTLVGRGGNSSIRNAI